MSAINSVNNTFLQSQLAGTQLREQIGYKIAAKTLDAARDQGDMVLTLLDSATDVARSAHADQTAAPTYGAIVSGLGQNLDLSA